MKKQDIVILFWTIGLFLIIIATINFSVRIPKIDNNIGANQNQINLFYSNDQKYMSNDQTAFLSFRLLTLLNKIGYNETDQDYKSLNAETLVLERQSLILLYNLKTNLAEVPSDLLNKWNNMDQNELQVEKAQYADFGRLSTLYSERDELTGKKDRLLFRTTFFQILGLILTQIGLALQLKWKL